MNLIFFRPALVREPVLSAAVIKRRCDRCDHGHGEGLGGTDGYGRLRSASGRAERTGTGLTRSRGQRAARHGPAAAERVAKVYDEKVRELAKMTRDAQRLITTDAFGDCNIGHALERKFNEKVQGPGGESKAGVIPILRDMQQTLKDMAQAYRDSARDMQNTDDENARDLGRNI